MKAYSAASSKERNAYGTSLNKTLFKWYNKGHSRVIIQLVLDNNNQLLFPNRLAMDLRHKTTICGLNLIAWIHFTIRMLHHTGGPSHKKNDHIEF